MALDGLLLARGSVIRSGGATAIVSGSADVATVITTLQPHGLTSGDTVFFTASTTSNPALTASPQQVVTVLTPTTFSVPVDCHLAGATAGAYGYAILSTPTTPGAAPLINCGRAHGLRVGDTVTIVASGSTPSLDGAQVVTAVDSPTAFRVLTSAAPTTVAGSTTAAHSTKTTYYSDVFDRAKTSGAGGLVITSVSGTAPVTTLMDIQGSVDGTAWYNLPYALVATPTTFVVSQVTIVAGTTTTYLLQSGQAWRFARLKLGSNTNLDVSAIAAHLLPS